MAAVLAAGDGAALSHLAAAVLWKAWRRAVHGLDVIAPRGRQVKGVRVHTYRQLDPRDITVHSGIPVTTVARTLVDLTDVLTAHQLANVIHEAAFRRRYSEAATRAAMQRAGGRRRLDALEQALAAHHAGSAGTKSELEDRFLALVHTTDLPDPLVNAAVQTRRRAYEVDFHWPERRLVVEIDGPGHRRPRTRREDAAKDEALREAGYRVLRFGGDGVDERALQTLTRPPPPHPAAGLRPP